MAHGCRARQRGPREPPSTSGTRRPRAVDAARFRRVSDTIRVGRSGEPEGGVEKLRSTTAAAAPPSHRAGAAPPRPAPAAAAGSPAAAQRLASASSMLSTPPPRRRRSGQPPSHWRQRRWQQQQWMATELVAVPGPARGHCRHWQWRPAVLRPGRRGPGDGDGRMGDGDEGMGDSGAAAAPMMRCCKGDSEGVLPRRDGRGRTGRLRELRRRGWGRTVIISRFLERAQRLSVDNSVRTGSGLCF